MRVVRDINIKNIKVDHFSITPQTLDLACKIREGRLDIKDLPPIKLHPPIDGLYKIKDGRHRITAFKLLGFNNIKSKFYEKDNSNCRDI